jgi:hypothetical protein
MTSRATACTSAAQDGNYRARQAKTRQRAMGHKDTHFTHAAGSCASDACLTVEAELAHASPHQPADAHRHLHCRLSSARHGARYQC